MPNFKPSFSISANRHNEYMLDGKEYKSFVFPTYAELKSKLRSIMEKYNVHEVCVSRSRRGEWGEYWEKWILSDGKLRIISKGWM